MYLLDTNVFISAHRYHYGFEFHPGFWEWLIHANTEGKVFSIGKVFHEICEKEDMLTGWAREHQDNFFLDLPTDIEFHLNSISKYIHEEYQFPHVKKFLKGADSYLIALAWFKKFKFVTHEVHKSSRKKIRIPSVCKNFGVEYISPFEMLRREKARFVWEPEP